MHTLLGLFKVPSLMKSGAVNPGAGVAMGAAFCSALVDGWRGCMTSALALGAAGKAVIGPL